MELVEQLMINRKWRNCCLRANIVTPEKIQMWKSTKLALVESNSPTKSLHDRKLKAAIAAIAPEWWDDATRICLNRNVQCERHRDGNKGYSYVLFLGDFEGGELIFEDGTELKQKYTWHKINGQIPHWNNPHTGNKYSIIIYQSAGNAKKTQHINMVKNSKLKAGHDEAFGDDGPDAHSPPEDPPEDARKIQPE